MPSLRDPDDATGARSVQRFVDNSLCPGLPTTMPFVEAVFGALAAMFDSPWLHVGGDEVAPGCVGALAGRGRRTPRRRGLAGTSAIEAAFMADVVAAVRRVTGRRVGAWQEVAEHGGLQPADGYVVAWKSAADARVLADAGFDVVVSAPDAYYLDMALDDDWTSPGASWAGTVGLDDVCAFEPGAGWSDDAAPTPARHPGVRVDRAHPVGGGVRRARLPPPRRDRRAGVAGPDRGRRRACRSRRSRGRSATAADSVVE